MDDVDDEHEHRYLSARCSLTDQLGECACALDSEGAAATAVVRDDGNRVVAVDPPTLNDGGVVGLGLVSHDVLSQMRVRSRFIERPTRSRVRGSMPR